MLKKHVTITYMIRYSRIQLIILIISNTKEYNNIYIYTIKFTLPILNNKARSIIIVTQVKFQSKSKPIDMERKYIKKYKK